MPRKRRRSPPPPGPSRETLYPTLDLHGDTADDARGRAERWLRAEQAAGARTVRLITGRGTRSVGPPVLPGEIDDLLRTLRGSLVERHELEPGGGSYRVELLRRVTPRGPARPRLRATPDDPELRRDAEESLAELGVHPTPELVEAEMERLLKERGGRR